MSTSFAQRAKLPCPSCGKDFTAEIWLVVDAAERPDLFDLARQNEIHVLHCPNCAGPGMVDAPLLLYLPDQETRLIFSPAQGTTEEQDNQHIENLLEMLSVAIGPTWDEDWTEELAVVPRTLLSTALVDGLEAATQKAQERFDQEMKRLQKENPQAYEAARAQAFSPDQAISLLGLIEQFLEAKTWEEAQDVVEEHHELIEAPCQAIFDQLIQRGMRQGDHETVDVLNEHRDLLRRCNAIGIQPAFDEKIRQASQATQTAPASEDRSDAGSESGLSGLSVEERRAITEVLQLSNDLPAMTLALGRLAEQHPEAYRQLEAISHLNAQADPFFVAFQALDRAETPTQLLTAARDHPLLLDAEGDKHIADMVETMRQAGDESGAQALAQRYAYLRTVCESAQASGFSLDEAIQVTSAADQALSALPVEERQKLRQILDSETASPQELRALADQYPVLHHLLDALAGDRQ